MTRYRRALAAASLVVILSLVCAAMALAQAGPRPHARITPQQKQASNALISQAISQLSNAQGALNGSNFTGAKGFVSAALGSLTQALPIYHGYRERAMTASRRALRQLSRIRTVRLAPASVAEALTNANSALQNAGDEVNERE